VKAPVGFVISPVISACSDRSYGVDEQFKQFIQKFQYIWKLEHQDDGILHFYLMEPLMKLTRKKIRV